MRGRCHVANNVDEWNFATISKFNTVKLSLRLTIKVNPFKVIYRVLQKKNVFLRQK